MIADDRGAAMRYPRTIRWTLRGGGREILTLDGSVDSPRRQGHGPGYVTAYSYIGTWRSEAGSGSAYLEWIDVQPG